MKKHLYLLCLLVGCSAPSDCDSVYYTVAGWFSSADTRPLLDSAFLAEATPVDICQRLKSGADPNTEGTAEVYFSQEKVTLEQVSLLTLASMWNPRTSVIERLLQAGTNIHAKDSLGRTTLMLAAKYNTNPEVIWTLLQAGANVNAAARGYNYATALSLAKSRENEKEEGKDEIIRLLKAAGAR